MNAREYKTDPTKLLEQGKAIMSANDDSRYLFKVFAVNMVLSGTPASQVGAYAGYTKASVTSWVKAVDEKGFESLRAKTHSGRPSKLTDQQRSEIDNALQRDPKEQGYKVWDGPSLSDYIEKEYRVTLSVRQCQRLLHSLGYSLIRPQTYPSKGYEDTVERIEFKKT